MPWEERMFARLTGSLMVMAVAAFVLSATGCGDKEKNAGQQAKHKSDLKEVKKGDDKKDDGKKELKGDGHGWWCADHGVPEDICSLCSSEAAAKFKKEGDWCKIHDRAQSQCFKCDAELYKKYEAMYVAKYNKKPEPPPKEEFTK
jgi:hypothetical protein